MDVLGARRKGPASESSAQLQIILKHFVGKDDTLLCGNCCIGNQSVLLRRACSLAPSMSQVGIAARAATILPSKSELKKAKIASQGFQLHGTAANIVILRE